jgi:CheY-like chemotaxis protein
VAAELSDAEMTVVIVDDHPMFRAGLRTFVEETECLRLAGEAADVDSAIGVCLEVVPDVVLMDLELPGASRVDTTRRIVRSFSSTAVLMLTMLEDDASVLAAVRGWRPRLRPQRLRTRRRRPSNPDRRHRCGHLRPALATEWATSSLPGAAVTSHPFPELTLPERDVLDRARQR